MGANPCTGAGCGVRPRTISPARLMSCLASTTRMAIRNRSYYHRGMNTLSVMLPEDLYAALSTEARRRNMTRSALVRKIIEQAPDRAPPRRAAPLRLATSSALRSQWLHRSGSQSSATLRGDLSGRAPCRYRRLSLSLAQSSRCSMPTRLATDERAGASKRCSRGWSPAKQSYSEAFSALCHIHPGTAPPLGHHCKNNTLTVLYNGT